MNDLIKRQKAIDLAHELIVPNEYKYGLYNQAINNYCVEIMQLPSAQPERQKGKWIPCSERLPEDGQEILATTTDNAWGDVVIIRTYYKEMHKSVIAWMPLPEPYAERRTDD